MVIFVFLFEKKHPSSSLTDGETLFFFRKVDKIFIMSFFYSAKCIVVCHVTE